MVRESSNLLLSIQIIFIFLANDAYAHGGISGAMSAVYFIFGLLLGAAAFVFLGAAFILKHYKKTNAALICV
ncbi:MAG: hypothetical protein ACR2PH_07465, partial [Desulfobulbia bacterium]